MQPIIALPLDTTRQRNSALQSETEARSVIFPHSRSHRRLPTLPRPIRFLPIGFLPAVLLVLSGPLTVRAQVSAAALGPGLPLTASEARALQEEISGELAMHHVRAITRWHRIQASPMMREAAGYVLARLREAGLDDAVIESFPSDGRRSYLTWLSPVGWTVKEAELWMTAPERRRITRYSEIANALVTLSVSADEEGILVDAGTGLDPAFYDSTAVRGKIVLASGYGGDVHRMAVLRYGALGVVCYNDRPGYPDQVRYTGMWPKAGERERIRWGFNISYRAARELKDLLAAGTEVRLRASITDGVLADGALDNVTATIAGARYPDREIVLMAHLDHPQPSANDNASGSAALLEIARALTRLIADGRLPRPDRTIRFLWVAEMHGTAAWLDAHPEVGARTAFGINLDMVGTPADLSVLQIIRNPASTAGVIDLVAAEAGAWVAGLPLHAPRGGSGPMNYRVVPYSGGSDHYMFIDGAIGVPTIMLNTWPDPYYHSSEDTPDRVDPTSLQRASLLAAATAWSLATLSPAEVDPLLDLQVASSLSRLSLDTGIVLDLLARIDRQMADVDLALLVRDAGDLLEAQLDREMRAVASVLRLSPSGQDSAAVAAFQAGVTRALARLEAHGLVIRQRVMETELVRLAQAAGCYPLPQLLPIAPLPERDAAAALVLQRSTRGPISDDWFLDHLPAARRTWYREGGGRALWGASTLRYEIVNAIDGTRSALDIWRVVSAAYGSRELAEIVTFLQDLQAAGLAVGVREGSGIHYR